MSIKYGIYTYITIAFMSVQSAQAEGNDYINGNTEKNVNDRLQSFFSKNPDKESVFWSPGIQGIGRYTFSISKVAYEISKKYNDVSDLYYLSKKIDNGLRFQSNKFDTINIFKSKNNTKLMYTRNFLPDVRASLFFQNAERKYFGITLLKDFIVLKNTLGNFGIEQTKHEYTVFKAKFVKLSNNENSEFYGNINHEFKSDYINVDIGNTWFDIDNQFDLTLGIQEQDKKLESELYATFGSESIKFQIGLNQIKNNSNMNMFFNLKFENALKKNHLGTNVIITSKDNFFGLRNLSLKSFRKKSLDVLWKKYMNYN
ncbi:hypothetical protein OAH74_07320 [Amylibacter sp.]|jgi:hypothetical protein|nr:hypothetical protein [Amylibacter sp.]